MLRKETRISRRGRKPPEASLNLRRKPLQSRSEETIAVILEASTQILETRGLAAFNTNAIAERAGVSIGSLYQYFPGKEAILAALHKHFEEQLMLAVNNSLTQSLGQTLQLRLRSLVGALIDAHTRSPNLHRILELEEDRILHNSTSSLDTTMRKSVAHMLLDAGLRFPGISIQAAAEDLCVIARALIDTALTRSTGGITASRQRRIVNALERYAGLST